MAKDDREIVRGIRVPILKEATGKDKASTLYKSGMEDELAAAMSQNDLDAAVERGDLTGTWKHITAKAADKGAKEK